MNDVYLPEECIDILREESEKIYFETHLKFLKSHGGLRPGCIHTIIGNSHAGKSTLVRSLIIDIVEFNPDKKILVWLSEESEKDFLTEFYIKQHSNKKLKNVGLVSEIDQNNKSSTQIGKLFFEAIKDRDIVLFDNITTSIFYMDKTAIQQSTLSKRLKELALKENVAMIVIAHTSAEITSGVRREIEMNDIRGNKSIVNLSHFFYIIQNFHIDKTIFTTIKITKHRGQECDHRMFCLAYVKEARIYAVDRPIDYNEFKEAFKSRNVL